MAINSEVYSLPAKRRDVGGVAIKLVGVLTTIADELEAIRKGEKPSVEGIAKIRAASDKLEDQWDKLAGWTDDK